MVEREQNTVEEGERGEPVKPASTGGGSKPEEQDGRSFSASTSSTLAVSLAIVILAALVRTGWSNVLLVVLCSILLLLNPWVRTFLELPTASARGKSPSQFSPYDPARFFRFESVVDEAGEAPPKAKSANSSSKKPLNQSESYAALRRMPAHLRTPLADLEELIIRDYVSTWYDYHSFGEQCLPNEARYSIDHAVGSIYTAMERVQSVEVVYELLLTSSSVLLTTLRSKRIHPNRKPIFSNDGERIAALRQALDRVFVRHLKSEDGKCDLLRILLREILCKQIWNAIGGIGEPDFINRKIVEWGDKQREKEGQTGSNGLDVTDVLLPPAGPLNQRQHAMPENSAAAAAWPHTDIPTSSTAPPLTNRRQGSPVDGHAPRASSPSTPSRPAPLSPEPLTTQPRAMAMPSPSPLGRNSIGDRTMAGSVPPSPREAGPPLPKRPLSIDRSNAPDQGYAGERTQTPILPPRKGTELREIQAGDNSWAVMPMNVPPEAHKGMALPDSLQKSMKVASSARESLESAEGYRLSTEERRPEAGQSRPVLPGRESASSLDLSPFKAGSSTFESQTTAPRSRPTSRPASSASGGIPPAPDLAEVLSSTGSPSLSALRDAFELFLERGGAASRSLFFSPPSAATVAPGEGEALLKLHVGLSSIARLVPNEGSQEGEVYREDAYSIAVKGLQSLDRADDGIAGRPLREALMVAVQRLEVNEDGRVREVMRPVELALWNRLLGLYDHFWKETCTRPAGSRPTVASPSLGGGNGRASFTASRPSEERPRPSMDQLHYQPRKKVSSNANASAPMSTNHSSSASIPRPGSTPPTRLSTRPPESEERPKSWLNEGSSTANITPAPPALPNPPPIPPRKEQMTRPVPRRGEVQPESEDEREGEEASRASQGGRMTDEPDSLSSIEISATDVSTNADRLAMAVDIRTYEVMIAVEGLVTGGGGFVLLRQWRDFVQLEEQLGKSMGLSGLPVRLPKTKGKTSLTLTREVEDYLVKLLSDPAMVENEAVQYFVDKTRAGEAASNRSSLLMDSLRLSSKGGLGLGKTLASGVGTVGKNAFSTLQMMPGNVAAMRTSTRGGRVSGAGGEGGMEEASGSPELGKTVGEGLRGAQKEEIESAELDPRIATAPAVPSPVPSQPGVVPASMELSQQELDNLLSCCFAIADEAFNLSGGWTLRRGMLRVLEQVVRTQYWSSIMGMFHNLSHSLNQEQIGSWLTQLKDKFWPSEVKSRATNRDGGSQTDQSTINDINTTNTTTAPSSLVDAVEETKERSMEEKQACHRKAKAIVIAQTPVGSAYFLGPGGKQSCEKALNLLHEEICKPETSLDLVLTVVLKLCDIVAG